MGKAHILFFDGTENHPYKFANEDGPPLSELVRESSNVEVLCEAISGPAFERGALCDVRSLLLGQEGYSYYMPGVGSPRGPQDSDLLTDRPDRESLSDGIAQKRAFIAAATGAGAKEQMMHAYVELAKNYEPGDKVVVVGFSRGACSARSFCGILNRCGIQQPGVDDTDKTFARRVYSEYRTGEQTGTQVPVEACVCFDSVPGPAGVFDASYHDFSPTNIRSFMHLLAMDENRRTFAYMPWDGNPSVNLSVWYPGVHSDVGGGYPQDPLSVAPILSAAAQLGKDAGVRFLPQSLLKNHGDLQSLLNAAPGNYRNSRQDFLDEHAGPLGDLLAKGLDLFRVGERVVPEGDKLHVSATYPIMMAVRHAITHPEEREPRVTRAFKSDIEALSYAMRHTYDDSPDVGAVLVPDSSPPSEDVAQFVSVLDSVSKTVARSVTNRGAGLRQPEAYQAPSIGTSPRR